MTRWLKQWGSLLIAALALCVSIGGWVHTSQQIGQAERLYEQAKDQYSLAKAQFQSSFKPLVDFDTEDDPENLPFGIAIENRGKGPAIIQSTTFWFNHTAYKSDADAIAAAKMDPDHISDYLFESEGPGQNDTLGTNEKEWLIYMPKRFAGVKKEADQFVTFLDDEFAIEVEYCSLAGECMKRCSTPSLCGPVTKP
jgi:hypothetical protein